MGPDQQPGMLDGLTAAIAKLWPGFAGALVAMAAALSLTDAQLDQLFITAAGIEA